MAKFKAQTPDGMLVVDVVLSSARRDGSIFIAKGKVLDGATNSAPAEIVISRIELKRLVPPWIARFL